MTVPTAHAPPANASGMKPAGDPAHSEATRQAMLRSKAVAAALGGVVAVMIQSPDYRYNTLADLEWLVGPSISLQQFALVEAPVANGGHIVPVAAVLWAMVAPDVDARLSRELDRPIRLSPSEWKSGDIPWIVVAAGDRNAMAPLLQQLSESKFKGNPPKIRVRAADGKVTVGRIEAKPKPA